MQEVIIVENIKDIIECIFIACCVYLAVDYLIKYPPDDQDNMNLY